MKLKLPHRLGEDVASVEPGEKVCIRIDGTVESNDADSITMDVEEAKVEYPNEDGSYSDEKEGGEDKEEDDTYSKSPEMEKHRGIIISIIKK